MPNKTPEQRIEELEKEVKRLTEIFYGNGDDPRLKANVRKQIIDGEHTSGKPTIIGPNGKRYNLQTV